MPAQLASPGASKTPAELERRGQTSVRCAEQKCDTCLTVAGECIETADENGCHMNDGVLCSSTQLGGLISGFGVQGLRRRPYVAVIPIVSHCNIVAQQIELVRHFRLTMNTIWPGMPTQFASPGASKAPVEPKVRGPSALLGWCCYASRTAAD